MRRGIFIKPTDPREPCPVESRESRNTKDKEEYAHEMVKRSSIDRVRKRDSRSQSSCDSHSGTSLSGESSNGLRKRPRDSPDHHEFRSSPSSSSSSSSRNYHKRERTESDYNSDNRSEDHYSDDNHNNKRRRKSSSSRLESESLPSIKVSMPMNGPPQENLKKEVNCTSEIDHLLTPLIPVCPNEKGPNTGKERRKDENNSNKQKRWKWIRIHGMDKDSRLDVGTLSKFVDHDSEFRLPDKSWSTDELFPDIF